MEKDEQLTIQPADHTPHPSTPAKRTLPVTIVCAIQGIQGILILGSATLYLLAYLHLAPPALSDPLLLHLNAEEMIFAVAVLGLLGILTIILAIGLRSLKPWAWLGAMFIQGLNLINSLISYMNHTPDYYTMVLAVFVVFLLNQREVRQACRVLEDAIA